MEDVQDPDLESQATIMEKFSVYSEDASQGPLHIVTQQQFVLEDIVK